MSEICGNLTLNAKYISCLYAPSFEDTVTQEEAQTSANKNAWQPDMEGDILWCFSPFTHQFYSAKEWHFQVFSECEKVK